jgi:6-phosphogluconolactonase
VAPDEAGVVRILAERLAQEIAASVAERGICRLALSGGKTPMRLYEHLAAGVGAVPWEALELFWGDERAVGPEDPESNFGKVRAALLARVPIAAERVHPMDGLASPEEAAAAYAQVLGPLPLDIALLGLGEDGHTASLFPGGPGLLGEPRAVVATRSPAPPHDRISLSLRTLNAARAVFFLATGANKAGPFARVAAQAGREDATLPAALVRPAQGRVTWFVDAAAARESPWRIG